MDVDSTFVLRKTRARVAWACGYPGWSLTKLKCYDKSNAAALAVANYLPVVVIDKCPQAPLGEITILCPDGVELHPG